MRRDSADGTATPLRGLLVSGRVANFVPLFWGLTFDMSGGGQTAKLAGRRPLDGGVRRRSLHASYRRL